MELTSTTRPVAPGARLTSFDRLQPDKWLRADALSLSLDGAGGGGEKDGARAEYLSSGKVSRPKPVSELAAGHEPGPGRRTVAALNADFFDIDATGAPLGPGLRDGRTVHSPAPANSQAVGLGPGAAGRILDLYFRGTLTLPDGREPLAAYNAANVPDGGIGAYNTQWGTADRSLAVDDARDVTEVTVRDGVVRDVHDRAGKGAIEPGTTVLLGRDAGAKALAGLAPGDRVSWEYRTRTDDGSPVPRTAVGGRGLLVVDGEAQNWEGRPNNGTAPRTAVGFSRDGSTMHVLTVDGRQSASGGVTLTELGLMMEDLGAHNALNLDGGGSSTLLARKPGGRGLELENAPSDGHERQVPNGLAITAPEGSGRLAGFRVETAADPDESPTADPVPGGHPERVFAGMTRRLTASGYDETYGPARGTPAWRSSRPGVGRADGEGVFHARSPGRTRVVASSGEARGGKELTVLGPMERMRPDHDRVALADSRDTQRFGFVGHDARGTSAPLEPGDVRLRYDRSRFTVTPDPARGGFTVRGKPGVDSASGIVTATAGGRTARLAVTVGLSDASLAEFDDADRWTFSAARAEGSLGPTPEGRTGQGLRLSYDFTKSAATRAAYATPPRDLPVPGQPLGFRMWVRGDGNGAWPSLHLKDAHGTDHVLRGPVVDWKGWRQITFDVPEGAAYPLRVHRFYLAETRPDARYAGEVVLDDLVARTPPDAELPTAPRPADPLISTAADVAGRDWRFAVLSDAQFVAARPDSEAVRQARRTLREIRAARPDFVVVAGDLVDEGAPEDLRFARRLLEEELGRDGKDPVKWTYVPGNHEVMGGSIETFVREIGPAGRVFDHKGTRFLTFDTSSLTLRGGGYAQFRKLRDQLDAAARDPKVRSVAVIQHVPPRDPTPQRASQLTDRREADLLERWLGRFRERSGKGAAFIGGHVGTFDASRVDGVPYLVNGNAAKNPATPPGQGGFTGWSLVGVDRGPVGAGRDWLGVQTRPHVDGLALEAPARVPAGERAEASAEVLQGPSGSVRKVPVRWPVSADWSGSRNLCFTHGRPGAANGRPPAGRCDATYDTGTGTLTAHRAGTVTLRVTVAGERAERQVRLTA
ncbi:phosphodiester glycosidase family protein [Streptomyces sp. HNM0574]|uniref:phosphodiester glycosidase family protein n=1 Tax=Streptomyces sp. HNM0574 TaxID=2714954 RepID=UPI00146AAC9D|nr:phosphodiester glycosidase family protein [Streptomyces sp. HNM0574]NLU67519.1 multidrug transporter [Streptomyces sp. HNM0574]